MPEKLLFVSADGLTVKTGDHGEVFIGIAGLGNSLNLAPGVEVVLHLTPDEAIRLAESLTHTARVAKARSTPK